MTTVCVFKIYYCMRCRKTWGSLWGLYPFQKWSLISVLEEKNQIIWQRWRELQYICPF